MAAPPADFDTPWKEVLERFLPDFLAVCLPDAHTEIDWSRGYLFLDKELQQVAPVAALGRRLVDALVRVWRRDGAEAWVLIHIEVQGPRGASGQWSVVSGQTSGQEAVVSSPVGGCRLTTYLSRFHHGASAW